MYDNSANGFCSLELKYFVKFPGILIDCNLKWKLHIDFISLKISKTIGIVSRLGHFVPTETLLMICHSLIMPYLSYGICVWGRAAKSYQSKLLVLQKRALRSTDLFCSQWCSCYSSFHWIKDLTCKCDLFWHDCKSHAWYLERSSPFALI